MVLSFGFFNNKFYFFFILVNSIFLKPLKCIYLIIRVNKRLNIILLIAIFFKLKFVKLEG